MKDSTKNQFTKLSEITRGKCETCPAMAKARGEECDPKCRCCDKIFCQLTEAYLIAKKIPLPEMPKVDGMLFMGEKGCVLPPWMRPFCTGYVCPTHLKEDREFRREYLRIVGKIERDPSAPPLKQLLANMLREAANPLTRSGDADKRSK